MMQPDWAGGLMWGVLGMVFGSFVSAVSWRLPRGESMGGRSACPSCGSTLTARDLVPLLSFLLGRGRCRQCGGRISWRYPACELAGAVLFLLCWRQGEGDLFLSGLLAAVSVCLLVIVVADLEHWIIPDAALIPLAALSIPWRLMNDLDWLDGLMSAGLYGLLVLAVSEGFRRLRGRDGIGLGDVKLIAVSGLYLGLDLMPGYLVLSGILGVGFGVLWRCGRGSVAFPFGPVLALALGIGLFYPALVKSFVPGMMAMVGL